MRGVTFTILINFMYQIISTHTPHARRDCETIQERKLKKFQLTRLMRGVTPSGISPDFRIANFNSHASCEA